MSERMPLPILLVHQVDAVLDELVRKATQYDNVERLDADQCFSLHILAAEIYTAGWRDGAVSEGVRRQGQLFRDRDVEANS